MRTRAPLDVFRYRDYRAFLREHYQTQKQGKSGYSLREFSRRAGLRSPNYLKLVMDGTRNLTSEMAVKFAQGCELKDEAAEYFCELVGYNQASSTEERERYYAHLKRFARFRKVHRLNAAQEAYHSRWYIPTVRELAVRADFQEDPKWIGKTLMPPISPTQAREALRILCELGLLARDDSGRLVQAEPLLDTPEGPLGHHVVEFHRAMMAHAANALDRVPRDEREISSLTLCLSQSKLLELKQELYKFRQALLQRYLTDEHSERVVQVNFQLFPLSKKRED